MPNTPAPCAFERDENGVFQQIKDWKPDEDEEDPDMDILQQCQKWHEEDKFQKIIDALEAIPAQSVPRKLIWSWREPTTIWEHLPTVRYSKRPSLS